MNLTEMWLLWGVMPLLLMGAALAMVRLVRGPSLPDRVVALDLVAIAAMAAVAVYAVATAQSALLDVVMMLALLSFLGLVAFATYIQRGAQHE